MEEIWGSQILPTHMLTYIYRERERAMHMYSKRASDAACQSPLMPKLQRVLMGSFRSFSSSLSSPLFS